ncbi:MAG: sulfotransferase family 2 domain-containing protein [Pegethrix bostrychoides GSE-TBD4-15B]|uniref:Sulfotransferase family 2 domain-containing protein n=1 Tax=Pegethrix bostrychoides GSE-TBD4-15B TaxID=2839662 RepID=A0A951PBJ3_9CYAN|nr:sulfotransferase family 2 domain-containing protein [Pegethrix bostrychoides GSE-TBD4-15B]
MTSIQYQLQSSDQLCFIRIPKTGSTTLISILDAKFDVAEICPLMAGDLPEAIPEELAKYRLFRGHFDYDLCRYLPHHQVYVTMLRHPLDRAVSYHEFCKRAQTDREFDRYLKQEANRGIEAFINHADPTIRLRTANCQTRYVAAGLGSRHSQPFTPSALESKYTDAELLALAKAHLDQFAFVGITERFQDAVLLLGYTFGWLPITDYQSLRVTTTKPKRTELAPELADAILMANQLDLELYHYAEQLFTQRFAQMLVELQAAPSQANFTEIVSFDQASSAQKQQIVAALEQHYQQRSAALNLPLLSQLNFDVLQALSGSGWHRRNGVHSGLLADSLPFRWTGPGTESTLDFPLAADRDLEIRIRIVNAALPELLESFGLKVNGHLVPIQLRLQRGSVTVFKATIPRSALRSDAPLTRLTLTVERTISLRAVQPEAGDDRVVGLAVHCILCFPVGERPQIAQDSYFLYFLLPEHDRAWRAAANFIKQHLRPAETIAAPLEFAERFPKAFCFYTEDFRERQGLAWVVVHKQLIEEIDPASLDWIARRFRPVFANTVFVIFSSRDLPRASLRTNDLRAFWKSWLRLKLARLTRHVSAKTGRAKQHRTDDANR